MITLVPEEWSKEVVHCAEILSWHTGAIIATGNIELLEDIVYSYNTQFPDKGPA